MADWLPSGAILTCIGGLSPAFQASLEARTDARGVTFECHRGLSDRDKFSLIAASQVMVFASRFEGFGLPPVEAACAGTPCIATDLDVVRENLGFGAVQFVPQGEASALHPLAASVSDVWSVNALAANDGMTRAFPSMASTTFKSFPTCAPPPTWAGL